MEPVIAVAAEEAALNSSAILVERADRRRWAVAGPQAADVLNGLVTNDMSRLAPGAGLYAAALTPKGKIIADLRIFAQQSDFLVDVSGAAAPGWAEVLRKYVNPRLAKYTEITDAGVDVAIAGPRAADMLAVAAGADSVQLSQLKPHHHLLLTLDGVACTVVRSVELAVPAFDVVVPADARERMIAVLKQGGAGPASAATWEAARIAHGWPMWGKDMDENTLAQEASLDARDAISFDKGCYTGQETVARVHFRGHVNRFLRRARFAAGDAIPAGAELVNESGKAVGDTRSTAVSAREGGVAIVMGRREVPGDATLTARWNERGAAIKLLGDAVP